MDPITIGGVCTGLAGLISAAVAGYKAFWKKEESDYKRSRELEKERVRFYKRRTDYHKERAENFKVLLIGCMENVGDAELAAEILRSAEPTDPAPPDSPEK